MIIVLVTSGQNSIVITSMVKIFENEVEAESYCKETIDNTVRNWTYAEVITKDIEYDLTRGGNYPVQ